MNIKRNIYNLLAKSVGFTVVSPDYNKPHYAFTYSEAVQWACMYHNASIYKRDRLVASKMLSSLK